MNKPYKRTVRQLIDGSYSNNGNWCYLFHPEFTNDPQHYIRAFLIIQKDLIQLFEFVEPCDHNSKTISLKIHELLTRTCIEIEANFTAILNENIYSNNKNWTLKDDFSLIEYSHKLSAYEVEIPIWKGKCNLRKPFENWKDKEIKDWHSLKWYQAYNKSKHDRHLHFDKATFENLLDGICGLVVLLTSQFMGEDFSPNQKSMAISGPYSYNHNTEMEDAIGEFFRVKYPTNWTDEEKYDFNWLNLQKEENPILRIDYDAIKKAYKPNIK